MIIKFKIAGLTNNPSIQPLLTGREGDYVYRTVSAGRMENDVVRGFVFDLARKLKAEAFHDFKLERSSYFIGQTRLFWNYLQDNWRRLVDVKAVEKSRGTPDIVQPTEPREPDVSTGETRPHSPLDEVIRKVDGQFQVQSRKGKNLGTYRSKGDAVKRLAQVEWFKEHPKNETAGKSSYQKFQDMNRMEPRKKLPKRVDDLWNSIWHKEDGQKPKTPQFAEVVHNAELGEAKLSGRFKCKKCGKAISKWDYDKNRQLCFSCDKDIPKDIQATQADKYFRDNKLTENPDKGFDLPSIQADLEDIIREEVSTGGLEPGDIEITGIELYGSRATGKAKSESDLDVRITYKGKMREDDAFNMFTRYKDKGKLYYYDNGKRIPIDVNPRKV